MGENAIYVGSNFTVERQDSQGSGVTVVKYPTAAIPSARVLARLQREYEIGTALDLPGVRRITARLEWKGRPAITLEYIPGETFKSYFRASEHRQLVTVLGLALSAAQALAALHAAGIVHRDIAAGNLLVREGGQEAVIIDLEFASRGGDSGDFVSSVEGQLPYISPEQTGRIDLPVDERSDLYSFGVVFYEMLTGDLPFRAEDAVGWIHAHLARLPESPIVRETSLPKVVSDIALRLLAKAPENRYQTARGLCHDLERCLDLRRIDGTISDFPLGHGDHSGRLRFPSGLYGREVEQQQLQVALLQAIAGEPGLQFVSGYAGAGKTALVNELRFPVAVAGGRFISGKFDQTLRALPYAAFAEAFAQLCHQLLAGTPAELEAFRRRVLETLGGNAGLLSEFVPILEAVIGPQASPPQLDTVESSNRFAVALLGFFHCMVSAEHPLVLFLDDVQWADDASLELVHMIVTRAVRKHFLIICAYRPGDLAAGHPLPNLMNTLQREQQVGYLSLGGLSLAQSTALVAGALDIPVAEAAPLAELVHAKTDGNPFFLRQVLETLVSEGVLHFEPQTDVWRWESERVRALDISDNVIELMLRKIARLSAQVRAMLQTAACIGSTFSIELLTTVIHGSDESLRTAMAPAVEEGLVALLGGNGRFTHDRIQQAVYQTLSASEAQRIHLQLGRALLRQREGHDLHLAAAQQLNLGAPLIDSDMERRQLAELNLEVGNAVRATMAYAAARDFYTMGISLLDAADEHSGTLLFELNFHQAETTFYLGEVSVAIGRLRELLQQAPDVVSGSRIYQLLLDAYTTELDLQGALATGKEALAVVGAALTEERTEAELLKGVSEIERIVAERGIEHIDEWPAMTDERELAIAGLLTHLAPPAYISAAGEFPFISMEFARRSLEGGLSRYSPFAFSIYGMLLSVALQRYEAGCQMGRLATEIAKRPDGAPLSARANFFHAAFVLHWCAPLEATLPFLDDGWKSGVENGDLQFSSYCINHIHGNSLIAGQSLAELEQSFAHFSDVDRIIRQEDGQHFFAMLERTVEALRLADAEVSDPADTIGGETIVERWRNSGNATLLTFYHMLRCMLSLVMNRTVEALADAEKVVPHLGGVSGMTWVPQHHFFHALALTDAARDESIDAVSARQRIDGYRIQMQTWAAHSPENYGPKWLLLQAELADLADEARGTLLDAYDEAIEAATRAGRTLELGLACERAAGCWLRRDKLQLAGLYLQRAVQTYEAWGAGAKVAQLLRDYAALLLPLRPFEGEVSVTTSSSSSDSLHEVDVYSVLKAAQAVAGELVMDRMLARLLGIVIETAGAQSGFLLLEQDGEWCVVAEQQSDRTRPEVLQWRPLSEYPEVAATVVQYVARTSKVVNLDDATKSTLFAADASIARRQCRSLLCLPIINRGELAGILYLENNLASHAFTRTHTQILQLLTTQAISSLEISRYYARVQSLNRSLEEEIDERKRTESQLEFLANHDALTNLPNRRLFYDRAKHAIQRAQRGGGRVAVLYLDLDRFKNINDTLSHQVGDRLLQQVALRLTHQVREEDTLARLGGDEYVLLMEGGMDLRDLSRVADKLLMTFRHPIHIDGHELDITCSLGISLYPDDAANADQLMRNADAAMYQAKQSGRNTYCFFSAELARAAAERLALEQDMRRAIEREEFELYFQPQVALGSGAVIGAEVLLRWNHPVRGLLLPGSFIPVAEESGNIVAIGEWVLRQTCRQLEQWRHEGIDVGCLAVNVSSKQFDAHGRFVALVRQVLDTCDIDPSNLELELTESVILQDSASITNSLAELTDMGVRLAIDDFGTGYSSLSYLHRLPMQRLKIDRSFVSNLPESQDSMVIVQSILLLGRNLKKQVIAEGVETEAQRRLLLDAGCEEGQGYLFGAPMSLQGFVELLHRIDAG